MNKRIILKQCGNHIKMPENISGTVEKVDKDILYVSFDNGSCLCISEEYGDRWEFID